MRAPRVAWAVALVLMLGACSSGWRAGTSYVADPRRVAEALGDPPPTDAARIRGLPALAVPEHERPCCLFGMDLRADVAGMEVPFFELGNVTSADAVSVHAYTLATGELEVETNGLVYTCRGGWIDTAHVAESADVAVFLAVTIAEALERGTTIVIPGHGAATTVVVDPIPESFLSRHGPMNVAATLAAWATFRISIWHELATWYGYQSVAGFSEQPSAFSPEDLYSNALGIRLGTAVLEAREIATEEEYDVAIAAFVAAALHRLGAQPVEVSRAIMGELDGRWWDSTRHAPDVMLVLRRGFPERGSLVVPWRAEDAFDEGAPGAAIQAACEGARTRSLRVSDHIGETSIEDLVHIQWEPEGWADATFPFPDASSRVVREQDLDALVLQARDAMREVLGAHFDAPRGSLGPG